MSIIHREEAEVLCSGPHEVSITVHLHHDAIGNGQVDVKQLVSQVAEVCGWERYPDGKWWCPICLSRA